MKFPVRALSFLFTGLLAPAAMFAQFSGSNLLEVQYGKLPTDTSAFVNLYDRAQVNYAYKGFKAGITLEQYFTKYGERNYILPTQYSLQYSTDKFEVKAGSLYETIGRGILLRSFEIPGAIIEDLSYRSRQYFHRDIFGASAKFRSGGFSAKAVYGKPLNYLYPPTIKDSIRRSDEIAALYTDYSFGKQTLGGSVLHLSNSNGNSIYGMLTASGVIFPFLSYHTEIARNVSDNGFGDFSDDASYAFYGSINLSLGNLGVSAEYKNYNNILLGAGINEPPALVKEHSYKVLNRSTHVLQPQNEQGYQVELFYLFKDGSTLTLNNTLAMNDFGSEFVFLEFFAGYDFSIRDNYDVKFFADWASDPLKGEENRISAGGYITRKLKGSSSINSDYEFQTFLRDGARVYNHLLTLGYAFGSNLVAAFTGELSNDSFQTEAGYKAWPGVNVRYKLNSKHSVQLFAGQRRGGPACNAGICYEVLDFEGVELKVTSRF